MTSERAAFVAAVDAVLSGPDQPPTWLRLAEVGVTGLLVPERWGGLGGTAGDLVAVAEELGRHALPGPVTEMIAAVPALLMGLGDEGIAAKWLPETVAGRVVATMAAPPWVPYAADAGTADLVLLATADSVWTGRCGRSYASFEQSRRLTEIGRGRVLAEGPAATAAVRDAINAGALAGAAQLLGAGHELLTTTIRYARQRTQFGRPIGAFQAVQHQLADVAVGLEFARPLLNAAADQFDRGEPGRDRDVSAAKVACGEAAYRAARVALQVHGAIGYTQEYGLGRRLTRVQALRNAWGTPSQHRARVMTCLEEAR